MAVIIGSARIDERGKTYGGKDGDQTTKEVSTQNFYIHKLGWYVVRAKSEVHAAKIADNMKMACSNDNIGYNQYDRLGIIKYGIHTKVKTACDCSSLVRECVREATGVDVGNFTTTNELNYLSRSGLFESPFEYKNGAKLYTGDILVTKTKGHTVIVTQGIDRKNNDNEYTKVAKEVIAGMWGNGEERRKRLACAGYSYKKVQAEVNRLLNNR